MAQVEKREQFSPTSLSLPMVLVATLLGSAVFAANLYFGLQIGSVNTMSQSTALLSFAIFKGLVPRSNFTPTENVVVQTMASSIAGIPIAASMLSIIPAFEFLRRTDEGGEWRFSLAELILWSLGVSLLGTIMAAPFRAHFLLKKRLRFPGGFATGVLLGALHKDNQIIRNVELDKEGLSLTNLSLSIGASADGPAEDRNNSGLTAASPDHSSWSKDTGVVLKAFGGTAVYVLASYFVPVLNRLPVFGLKAASPWLWFVTISPAFTAFGMIVDLSVAVSMMVGAVIGWAVLSPIAKLNKWAPGPVDSMENGVRGWLIWIATASLLGDTLVWVLHTAGGMAMKYYYSFRHRNSIDSQRHEILAGERQPLLDSPSQSTSETTETSQPSNKEDRNDLISSQTILCWLVGSTTLCIVCTHFVFDQELPFYIVPVAVGLTFPLCLIVMQSTGETDTAHAPSNSLSNACQFLFFLLLPKAAGSHLITMVAAAITKAGLWESAVLMTDMKTAYLVRASPRVMFHTQLLGSVIGCFTGSAIYRLLFIAIDIPRDRNDIKPFAMPLAHMWVNTARLANGTMIPPGVISVGSAAFLAAACLRLLDIAAGARSWKKYFPSAIAISVGMLVPPSVTLAKLAGAGLRFYLIKRWNVTDMTLMVAATGCILGEGTLGFIPMIIGSFS